MKYKTKNGWTKEKMIEAIKTRNNGKPCVDELGDCVYSDDNGNHCAVGVFIPDDHAATKSDYPASALTKYYKDLELVLPIHEYGLDELQIVHDQLTYKSFKNLQDIRPLLIDWIEKNVE